MSHGSSRPGLADGIARGLGRSSQPARDLCPRSLVQLLLSTPANVEPWHPTVRVAARAYRHNQAVS